MSEETKRALLAAAANRMGVTPLARQLNVPDSLLAAWMSGHASMPDRKLLVLAALLEKLSDNP